MNCYWYIIITKVYTFSDFLNFYLMFFFCSEIPSRIHYILSSCLLRILLAVTVSCAFLVLMIFRVLENIGLLFYKVSLCWDLSDVFLLIRRKTTEVKYHFHHFVSRALIINMIYHWQWPWSPGWGSSCQVFLLRNYSPAFHNVVFGKKSFCVASV